MPPLSEVNRRLDQARELIREKRLSRQDLDLLDEILRIGDGELEPRAEAPPAAGPPEDASVHLTKLRRSFGLFLAFLNQFSDKRLGEVRQAMGMVLLHSLTSLQSLAEAARHDLLDQHREPERVIHLLDLIASLRTMATSLGSEEEPYLQKHWSDFLTEGRDRFREIFQDLGGQEEGPDLTARLNQQMKALNRSLQTGSGRPLEAIRKLETLLEGALPEETRRRAEPLLLVQHVIANLRMTLFRPLDRGIHWPAVEQVRGSLQWLWNHLGWSLPRVEDRLLEKGLSGEVRDLLKQLRQEHPSAFRIVAKALASHLTMLSLVERTEPAANASVQERYAMVPTFYVLEAELGRLADRVYHPRVAEHLPKEAEEALLLGAFLRQAVLSLLQDQATIRSLLQQSLSGNDADLLAGTLDNLKALLISHQQQLMADLAGLFSPALRQRLFPDSRSLTEEGDRLRQRLHRLWEHLDPVLQQIQLHLELQDWPRLALTLGQTQNRFLDFRRSPEFLLIRSQDRQEFDRLTQQFTRTLDAPADILAALKDGAEQVEELLRFLDVFLLRINTRVPLIRLDLTTAREALKLCGQFRALGLDTPDRSRCSHRLIQTTKPLGVRDAQTLTLLKRWVRAERGGKDSTAALELMEAHLERLAARLDAALS
ncbi:MAG TPA: hypothetical protein PLA48_03020 [Holophaga sp.]|nr:hypothetical protein [Holophaga sp.]